jgi:hypothetical protein
VLVSKQVGFGEKMVVFEGVMSKKGGESLGAVAKKSKEEQRGMK